MAFRADPLVTAKLVRAAEVLGWVGVVRWPVMHAGDVLAVVHEPDGDPAPGPAGSWLRGCLLPGNSVRAVKHASLLAGYSRRAVLLLDDRHALEIAVDAAILDVGLVLGSATTAELLVCAGPVVESPLTSRCAADDRWRRLVNDVLASPVVNVDDARLTSSWAG